MDPNTRGNNSRREANNLYRYSACVGVGVDVGL